MYVGFVEGIGRGKGVVAKAKRIWYDDPGDACNGKELEAAGTATWTWKIGSEVHGRSSPLSRSPDHCFHAALG